MFLNVKTSISLTIKILTIIHLELQQLFNPTFSLPLDEQFVSPLVQPMAEFMGSVSLIRDVVPTVIENIYFKQNFLTTRASY